MDQLSRLRADFLDYYEEMIDGKRTLSVSNFMTHILDVLDKEIDKASILEDGKITPRENENSWFYDR